MPIPKLYTALSLNEINIEVFTDHYSEIVEGSEGEKYAILSYFPKVQKYSSVSNFLLNKHVLFVDGENTSNIYSVLWDYTLTDFNGRSVLNQFVRNEINGLDNFELNLVLKDTDFPTTSHWELTLRIDCSIFKNGQPEGIIGLEHTINPIEAEFLARNGAPLDSEGALPNSAIPFGHELTTHVIHGHLRKYLVDHKMELDPDMETTPNNSAAFTHQTTSIIYYKLLRHMFSVPIEQDTPEIVPSFDSPFTRIFTNSNIENPILLENAYQSEHHRGVGICQLNLHHVLPIIMEVEAVRVDDKIDIPLYIERLYDEKNEKFILAYLRSTFPKSAIALSAKIFDKLFNSFKREASNSSHIYDTFLSSETDSNAKIRDWKQLTYDELRSSDNDDFMKNLIAEYSLGYCANVEIDSSSENLSRGVIAIDWSQFIQKILSPIGSLFSLNDFLTSNELLDHKVEEIFKRLPAGERVAQMIMPAAEMAWKEDINDEDNDGRVDDYVRDFTRDGPSISEIPRLLADRKIGGVLLLNGTKEQVDRWSRDFKAANERAGGLPLLISADAEPTLINDKIRGLPTITRAYDITSLSEVEDVATQICDIIDDYGVNYNFAPVADVAKNYVRKRSFGKVPTNLLPFCKKFIETVQNRNIIATAKHFPGHGEVIGDTHKPVSGGDDKKIVVIDGEFLELDNYPPLIADGVLSIMIAHIVVRNNEFHTDGLPASISPRIVTDLLRDQLGFEGLIVTDGMNMGAVTYVEDECIKAVEAGVDIIEIPLNPGKTHADFLAKYNAEEDFSGKVDTACRRIIRAKICLGLI
ncbi:MAG: glycoside hydrolase family 3 N-terminal domain-containing protein [Crocinitomicaceae bacterium]